MFSLYMSWRQIFLLIMIFVPISLSICAATVLWGFNRIGSSYEVLHESALYQADSMAVFANLNRLEKILMNPAQPPSASIAEGLEMLGEQSDRIALSSQLFGNATLSGIAGNIDQSIGDYISARIAWMEKMELAGYSRDQGLKAVTEKTQAQLVESTMGTQDEAMQRIGSALARYYDDPTERTAAAVNNALDLFGEQVEMFGWGDTAIGESFEQLRDVFSQLNQALMSAGLLSQQVTEIYDHLEGFDEQQRHVIDSELQATTLRQAEEARASARNTTLIAFFLVITLLLIVLAIVSRTLGTQLQRFISLFSRVAGGDLTGGVPSSRNYRSEFTKLAESANQMIHGIAQIIIQAKDGTDRLSSVKQELDSTMDRLSQSNDTVSHGIQEVATSSQEISVTVNDIASRTNEVGLSARRVNEQAERGSVVVKDSANALTELSGLIREAHQLMRSLKDSSNQVNGIVTVINGIAGQTNLLALNAAIEAARAGEAGRGFAVVADEVRTLAGQTVSATSDIAGIVANLESRTSDIEHLFENGLGLAEKGEATSSHIAETMRSIESSLEALSGEMDQVVVAVEEVSATTDDMAMRLEGAREQTEGITAVISELGAQDRILGRVALELDDATSKFLLTK